VKEFKPHPALRSGHLMTLVTPFLRRRYPQLRASDPRLFDVEPGTQIRGDCHWQAERAQRPTLLLLHGLEGSSDSGYMLGTAEKVFIAGFNVVRLNQRNCGGTEKLTPTLYHSGRSPDFRAIVNELIERDRLPEIFFAGFSMGGNLALKMAGEFGTEPPKQMRGIVAVAPCIDLAACCDALSGRRNYLYNRHFVRRLRARMRYKAGLFPKIYAQNGFAADLARVRNVREFDEAITARFCGFTGAADYYERSSAMHFVEAIRIPTLIVTAEDDPFVPIAIFDQRAIRENPNITFVATRHGGHCAFVSNQPGPERFWAEARIAEFCLERSKIVSQS
jgi:uncharacterized protein